LFGDAIMKYKLLRRGPAYCVRTEEPTDNSLIAHWAIKNNTKYRFKRRVKRVVGNYYNEIAIIEQDFIFPTKSQAMTFILAWF
jgi:hypothetical protein